MNKSVVVYGSTLVDINFQIPNHYLLKHSAGDALNLPFGEKLVSKDYSLTVGGSGANIALGLKKLGLDITLRTSLSQDAFSDYIKKELAAAGVGVVDSISKNPTPLSVVLRAKGDRTIITGSSHTTDFLDIAIPETGWIHIGPLSDDMDKFLQKITDHRIKTNQGISMNPSMAQVEERTRVFISTLKMMDIIFLNLQEALRLTHLPQKTEVDGIIRSIQALGVRTVCITDGLRGAYVSNREHIWRADVVCDEVCRVDATGAGDAFASGFLAGYLADNDNMSDDDIHEKCLKMAMLNSGSVVEGIGAQSGLLTLEKIEQDLGTVKIKLLK